MPDVRDKACAHLGREVQFVAGEVAHEERIDARAIGRSTCSHCAQSSVSDEALEAGLQYTEHQRWLVYDAGCKLLELCARPGRVASHAAPR